MSRSTRAGTVVSSVCLTLATIVAQLVAQSPPPFAYTETPGPVGLGVPLGLGDVDGDGDLTAISTP